MGNAEDLVGTTDVLTRLAVAGETLRIDLAPLNAYLTHLGSAPAEYARVTLGEGLERLGFGVQLPAREPIARASSTPYSELEVGGALRETVTAHGPGTLAQDLTILADAGVRAAAREQLAAWITELGGGRTDRVSRSFQATSRWTIGVAFGGSVPEVMTVVNQLVTLATALGIQPMQRRHLEQAHQVLGAGAGCVVELACDVDRALPEITITYRDVAWKHAVGLHDALRPGTPCGPRLGAFAGAFNAEKASLYEITFRADAPAIIRVGIELVGSVN
ncbi:MAG: hypothetical protein H0T42_16095 [Deltaproteobacteria bacterium]|nr:hypothetical protein [Deltaproteobacteria bacterium]